MLRVDRGCRTSHTFAILSPEADRNTSPCAGFLQYEHCCDIGVVYLRSVFARSFVQQLKTPQGCRPVSFNVPDGCINTIFVFAECA
jgi:hypothetical protein